MKTYLRKSFQSIYFQALILALIAILLIPMPFSRHHLKLVGGKEQKVKIPEYKGKTKAQYYVVDMNGDGIDEFLSPLIFKLDRLSVFCFNTDFKFYDQFNFPPADVQTTTSIDFADLDDDGYKEIAGFTLEGDSVFLNIIEPFDKTDPITVKRRFLVTISQEYYSEINYEVHFGDVADINGDGHKEWLFSVEGIYSLQPRILFAYTYATDSVIQSPNSGMNFCSISSFDSSEEGKRYVATGTYSVYNMEDTVLKKVPYRDDRAWFTVFNPDLSYRFEPISYPELFTYVIVRPIIIDGANRIIVFTFSKSHTEYAPRLQIFTPDGQLLKQRKLIDDGSGFERRIWINHEEGKSIIYVFHENHVEKYNTRLERLDLIEYPGNFLSKPIQEQFAYDLDNDGEEEFLAKGANNESIGVYESDLSEVTVFHKENSHFIKPFVVHTDANEKEIWVFDKRIVYKLSYGFNPLYYWKYPVYAGIYLATLLLIFIIRKLYERQLREKYAMQSQINELKLKTIKSQISPHFILNAANSIGVSILDKGGKEAYQSFNQFSSMMKRVLKYSDEVMVTLEEELSFCRDFLDLNQLRFKNAFSYSFEIDDQVDKNILVPKMLIQIHVENAFKHGIRPMENTGHIKVIVHKAKNTLMITIEDNGVGRIESRKNFDHQNYGYGNRIIDNYKLLLNKENPGYIKRRVIDLYDDEGRPAGTQVKIKLSLRRQSTLY